MCDITVIGDYKFIDHWFNCLTKKDVNMLDIRKYITTQTKLVIFFMFKDHYENLKCIETNSLYYRETPLNIIYVFPIKNDTSTIPIWARPWNPFIYSKYKDDESYRLYDLVKQKFTQSATILDVCGHHKPSSKQRKWFERPDFVPRPPESIFQVARPEVELDTFWSPKPVFVPPDIDSILSRNEPGDETHHRMYEGPNIRKAQHLPPY